ncbi:MAG: hypothetical protein AB8B78_05480, partial [Polaribacter sp.]
MIKKTLLNLSFLILSIVTNANDFYVATNGDNSNAGTIDSPLSTIQKAQELANSGDTVYIRGG